MVLTRTGGVYGGMRNERDVRVLRALLPLTPPEQPYLGIRLYADQAESFLTLVRPYVGQLPTLLGDCS